MFDFLKSMYIYFFYSGFTFITDFKLLMFHNNIVKILEILNMWNLLKTCIQTTRTYPIKFCIFCTHFYYGEYRKYSNFWKTND